MLHKLSGLRDNCSPRWVLSTRCMLEHLQVVAVRKLSQYRCRSQAWVRALNIAATQVPLFHFPTCFLPSNSAHHAYFTRAGGHFSIHVLCESACQSCLFYMKRFSPPCFSSFNILSCSTPPPPTCLGPDIQSVAANHEGCSEKLLMRALTAVSLQIREAHLATQHGDPFTEGAGSNENVGIFEWNTDICLYHYFPTGKFSF